jgi:hypothetical protein
MGARIISATAKQYCSFSSTMARYLVKGLRGVATDARYDLAGLTSSQR